MTSEILADSATSHNKITSLYENTFSVTRLPDGNYISFLNHFWWKNKTTQQIRSRMWEKLLLQTDISYLQWYCINGYLKILHICIKIKMYSILTCRKIIIRVWSSMIRNNINRLSSTLKMLWKATVKQTWSAGPCAGGHRNLMNMSMWTTKQHCMKSWQVSTDYINIAYLMYLLLARLKLWSKPVM